MSARLIRAAELSDAAQMLAIYRPIVLNSATSFELEPPSESELRDRLQQGLEGDPWMVLEIDQKVAGYAYASTFRSRKAYAATKETTVYVGADHRRRGVAGQLMDALLDELATRGAHTAIAVIALPNEPSVRLHEKLGFVHAGTLSEVGRKFNRWHDVGLWQINLSHR